MGEMYLRKPSLLHPTSTQEGRLELIKKGGGENAVSIVLDRPLDEAKAPVEDRTHLGNYGKT